MVIITKIFLNLLLEIINPLSFIIVVEWTAAFAGTMMGFVQHNETGDGGLPSS